MILKKEVRDSILKYGFCKGIECFICPYFKKPHSLEDVLNDTLEEIKKEYSNYDSFSPVFFDDEQINNNDEMYDGFSPVYIKE